MRFDVSSVLLQWATGGLAFLWVTTRHRVVGLGYGWLLRGVYAAIASGALVAGLVAGDTGTAATIRDLATAGVVAAALGALVVSVVVRGRPERFPTVADLVAPAFGVLALAATVPVLDGGVALSAVRLASGAMLMGAVSDAMLLGHWYLVQPGLSRGPIREIVRWCMIVWPVSFVAWCLPEGGIQILSGSVDDGWAGMLGWTWLAAALTTLGLVVATWFALKERSYSAVMAATGLLYLAILTAFGMDIVPRAVLAS